MKVIRTFIVSYIQCIALRLENNPTFQRDPELFSFDHEFVHSGFYEDNSEFISNSKLEYVPGSGGRKFRIPKTQSTEAARIENTFRWQNRMLVVPEHKFAFCYIEKVACTQFNLMMNRLNGRDEGHVFFVSNVDKFNLTLQDISRKKGWFRGIFLRKPLYRFLSAYESKCLPHHDGDQNQCITNPVSEIVTNTMTSSLDGSRARHFRNAVKALETYESGINPHYDPMSDFCGGLSGNLSDYDFVGHLDRGYRSVHQQVGQMLRQVGINFDSHLQNMFPENKPNTSKHTTNTQTDFRSYYDREAQQRVRNYYTEDYRLLRKVTGTGRMF